MISPLIKLELQYLFEAGKIRTLPKPILTSLRSSIGLEVASIDLDQVVEVALDYNWTRDPFDRLITATAQTESAKLVTADANIHQHYPLSVW